MVTMMSPAWRLLSRSTSTVKLLSFPHMLQGFLEFSQKWNLNLFKSFQVCYERIPVTDHEQAAEENYQNF